MTTPKQTTWNDAIRLAVTTFTVWPLQHGDLDRRAAGRAMALAPLIGALLGAVVGIFVAGLRHVVPPALAGVLGVGLAAMLTRGLHLDGTADTVDSLGSYRDRESALAIMKSPEIGPFGVVALTLVILIQALALSDLPPMAAVTAFAAGRLAVTIACVGVPAARPSGLGLSVAESVSGSAAVIATLAVLAVSLFAIGHRPWQGPLAVAASLPVILAVLRHVVRRLGGITGDVLGFLVEAVTCVALVALTIR